MQVDKLKFENEVSNYYVSRNAVAFGDENTVRDMFNRIGYSRGVAVRESVANEK